MTPNVMAPSHHETDNCETIKAKQSGPESARTDRGLATDRLDRKGRDAIMAHPSAIDYILARIDISSDGCWVWSLRPGSGGYGIAILHRRREMAHRLSYETFKGPLIAGMVIHHACFNTLCVNPVHLTQVTNATNLEFGSGREAPTPTRVEVARGAPAGHGTVSNYTGAKCRCNHCREAMRVYARERQVRLGRATRPAKGGYAKVRGGVA